MSTENSSFDFNSITTMMNSMMPMMMMMGMMGAMTRAIGSSGGSGSSGSSGSKSRKTLSTMTMKDLLKSNVKVSELAKYLKNGGQSRLEELEEEVRELKNGEVRGEA